MSSRKIRWVALIASLFLVLTFQNCEGLQPGTGEADIASANGDGYSGIVAEHPDTVESGSSFAIRVQFIFVNGLQFELIEGQAAIHPIPGTHRAIVNVAEDYVGSLVIRITNQDGQSTLVEVQVVAPRDITDGEHNQSFAKTMLLSGKRIIAGTPLANDSATGAKNQGRVMIYNHNAASNEIKFFQGIQNPEPDLDVEARFGQAIDAHIHLDLLVGAPNTNKVFQYRAINIEDRIRFRYELVEVFENPDGERFGDSVIINEYRMVIAEKGPENVLGAGKLYVYTRADSTVTKFNFSHQIDSPPDVFKFGRSIDKVGNLLLVSASRPATVGRPRRGVVLVYDTMTGSLLQTIDQDDASPDYGRVLVGNLGYLFLGGSWANNVEHEQEFVDVFKLNTNTNRYDWLQRLSNPVGEDAKTLFAQAVAFNGKDLFVSAPKADSPQQVESGIVYTYRLNPDVGIFERTGVITPSFEKFDYVKNLGRALACDQDHLFISVRGILKDQTIMNGEIYAVPLK